MPQHILILGTTGVDKDMAIRNLRRYQEDNDKEIDFEHINLEKIICSSNFYIKIHSYVRQGYNEQIDYWCNGWREFKKMLDKKDEEEITTILSMHAILVHKDYGIRCPIIVDSIVKEFNPEIIITLINDAYLKWHRTEVRAGKKKHKGKPNLEQLLQARRAETLLGGILAKQKGSRPYLHTMLFLFGTLLVYWIK